MKRLNLRDIIIFLFMVLFIYAATTKLLEYETFKAQIGKSPLITKYAGLFAWLVPASELITAIVLFLPKFQLVGLYMSFSLMFAFTAYIGVVLTLTTNVPCSCGGILNNMGWTEHLIFNILFTILAILGIAIHTRKSKFAKVQTQQN